MHETSCCGAVFHKPKLSRKAPASKVSRNLKKGITEVLSKSEYMMFLKHPAWLWIKKHQPKLLPKIDAKLQTMFDQGHEFERYVESLFPDVERLGFADYESYLQLPHRTREVWREGASSVAQGRYEFNEITCITDLLVKVSENTYKLVEIKSSTKAKEEHYFDLAFQRVVLEGAGYEIETCELAVVNSGYVRDGAINSNELVKFLDVTEQVNEKLELTRSKITQALMVIKQKNKPPLSPELARLSSYNEWMKIYQRVAPELPRDSIYRLPNINAQQVTQLLEHGVHNVNEVAEQVSLPKTTQRYLRARRIGHRKEDKKTIKTFLDGLNYPLYFFDYETTQSLVPKWNRTKPYQQVTFQYSLHVLHKPDGELKHYEYLHRERSNPSQALLSQLAKDIGDHGSIISWHASFERDRNNELSTMYPEYRVFLEGINSRLVDLKIPFSEEMVIDPEFQGSASIKAVLPIFCPELDYTDLNIQEGTSAARLWKKAIFDLDGKSPRDQIFKDLSMYCERDTYAMVAIHEKLRSIIS